ncbi:MAG: copper chaperone PCu(A)C [Gammaproteobacteria bacterium]|nr:copper chaperone PCu(A)C [Gammaproteobacteria bacterium]
MPRLLLILALLFPGSALAELEFSDAWIKNLPPTIPVRAGYMTMHNPGPGKQTVVAMRSEAFASVEIHRSFMQDGMMRMEPVDKLGIDADASVKLEPGGLHLMMMMPHEPTSPGDEIVIFVKLGDGSEQSLKMTVVE